MYIRVTTSGTLRMRVRLRYTYTCIYVRVRVARDTTYGIRRALQSRLSLDKKISETSVKIIKNEVGCRDDTVPKTVDTRRHCEEE